MSRYDRLIMTENIESVCVCVCVCVVVVAGHTTAVHCVAWSPVHGQLLVSGASDGSVLLWDVRKGGRPLQNLSDAGGADGDPPMPCHAPLSPSVCRSPLNRALSTTSHFVIATDCTFVPSPHCSGEGQLYGTAHNGAVSGMCFCPGGIHLLTVGEH